MRSWLKLMRTSKKLTQRELAVKLGISANYLCYIENGQRQKSISLDLLNKFAIAFDVPVADLIAEETKLQSTAS